MVRALLLHGFPKYFWEQSPLTGQLGMTLKPKTEENARTFTSVCKSGYVSHAFL